MLTECQPDKASPLPLFYLQLDTFWKELCFRVKTLDGGDMVLVTSVANRTQDRIAKC